MSRNRLGVGLAFITPWMAGFLLLYLGPFVLSFIRSFTQWGMLSEPKFVGLRNYIRLFTADPYYLPAFINTLFYVFVGTLLSTTLGLVVAQMLSYDVFGVRVFRTVFMLPVLMPVVAASLVFVLIYDYDIGALNNFIRAIGGSPVGWLTSARVVKTSIVLTTVWKQGRVILIFVAAIKGIPAHLYESATIDGANSVQKFFRITVPQVSAVIVLNSIVSIIGYFQIFAEPYVMTNGGPGAASQSYALYLYQTAFQSFRMGYASAMSSILFVVIMVITILYLKLSHRFVYSEV